MNHFTEILGAIEQGDPNAAEKLLPLVYDELRKLASAKLSHEKPGTSIQPTMLVHEVYVRLMSQDQPHEWNSRGHFFAAAAEAMRRILIEYFRRKSSQKRAGVMENVDLDLIPDPSVSSPSVFFALDDALISFEQKWPNHAKLVKLRYFTGLTIPEAALAIGVSTATAERYWRFARAWLHSRLKTSD